MSLSPTRSVAAAAPTPLQNFKSSLATRERIVRHGGQIEFIHNRIQLDLKELEREIKSDGAAQEEYSKQLKKLADRKAELRKLIRQQREWTDSFDVQIGPFEARYDELQRSCDGLHKDATKKYDAAIQMLIDKLGYHPAFKRHNDII